MSSPPPQKPVLKRFTNDKLKNSESIQTKVVVVGDGNVGKTTILNNIVTGQYTTPKPTIGVQPAIKKKFSVFNDAVEIIFWDFSGQDRFQFLRAGGTWYKGATAALLVYDSTNKETFNHLPSWFNELKRYADLKPSQIICVANKYDLVKDRQVTDEDLMQYAKQNDILLAFHTSAKTGENVSPAFDALAHYAVLNYKLREGKKVPEAIYKNKIKAIYQTVLGMHEQTKYSNLI